MKSPAFQFYPTDYLGSQRVQMMTLEEEGAYCRLLWSCWQHGSIPSDPELAARLVGKGCSTTVARVVLPMFEIACGENRLTHDRLEREREKQADWRAKSAEGGRKSAAIRQSKTKGGSTVVEPPYQPNGNIPTPSPSPSSVSNSVTNSFSILPEELSSGKPDMLALEAETPTKELTNEERRRADAWLLLDALNEEAGRRFRHTPENIRLIVARLSEPGVTASEVDTMICRQVALWKDDPKMREYLQPSTLFGKEKFSGYYDKRDLPVLVAAKGTCL